jgi:putative hydrolase
VTDLSAVDGAVHAWSRAEWVDQTMPMWRELVEPVAVGVSTAVVAAMRAQMGQLGGEDLAAMPGLPAGMDPGALMGQLEPMLARVSGSMFGAQVGQAVGALATDLVSGTDVGLPLVPGHGIALMPANIESFADGLEVDLAEVRLYLAVREAARVGLFAEVAWLGPQLVAAVQAYARDISIDTEGIESALQSIDPSDPAAMQAALSDSLFTPEPSPAQRSALTLLETYLALVEGWVDVVADRAASKHLPHAAALGEAVRRRRASGGPAERVFSQLVGLELRPRRLRDAANLWAALEAKGGAVVRDGAWAHPDLAPTAADLDDPLGYVDRFISGDTKDEMDAALDALLSEGDSNNP